MSNVIERAAQKDMQKKLTDMKQAQDNLKQEQQDLKEHTLNSLDALNEKMEWFLSKGQQGAHPLSDRISLIEEHLEQQNATLAWIKDVLSVSKRFNIDMCKMQPMNMACSNSELIFPQVPEIPDIDHIN